MTKRDTRLIGQIVLQLSLFILIYSLIIVDRGSNRQKLKNKTSLGINGMRNNFRTLSFTMRLHHELHSRGLNLLDSYKKRVGIRGHSQQYQCLEQSTIKQYIKYIKRTQRLNPKNRSIQYTCQRSKNTAIVATTETGCLKWAPQ